MENRTIVVKLGTSVLTGGSARLNRAHMVELVRQCAALHRHGHRVVLVTSGAIAAGGTYAIGVSAIAYYIDGTPRSALKEVFQTAQERALELLRSEGTNWLRQKVGK